MGRPHVGLQAAEMSRLPETDLAVARAQGVIALKRGC